MKYISVLMLMTVMTGCALLEPSWDEKLEIIREGAESDFKSMTIIREVDPSDEKVCGGKKNLYLCTAYRRYGGKIYFGRTSTTYEYVLLKDGKPLAAQGYPCSWRWAGDKGYCDR